MSNALYNEAKAIRYAEAVQDAGLFRIYLAFHYGQTFEFGGSSAQYFRGRKLAGHLSKAVGTPLQQIINNAISDAQIIFA